jgi:hypothetical protein
MVNGKNKGSSYERKIANLLSKRFQHITGKPTAFRRNADSGSYFGGTNQKRLETHNSETATLGDIICPGNFLYSIECKHYKKPPSLSHLLTQNCREWDGWIRQAQQDSTNSNRKFMLIIKYNNVEDLVLLKEAVLGSATIAYREYFVVPLTQVLAQPDSVFFSDPETLATVNQTLS